MKGFSEPMTLNGSSYLLVMMVTKAMQPL